MVLGSQAERGIRSGYGIGHTDVKVVSGEGEGVVRPRSQAQWGAQIREMG